MSIFKTHRPGQAKLTRAITLFSGLFLIAWACRSLMRTIPTFWPDGGDSINASFLPSRVDIVILDEKFSPAFVLAAVLAVGLSYGWWRFLNRERWADLLIDMETELRKVSWPTPGDAWQSTLIVTGFTATVVVTILVYDVVIRNVILLFVKS